MNGAMPAGRVALTFDAEHPDRPTSTGAAERLLELLDRLAIPASFFVQGRSAEANPATARRIAQAGHAVGSHSFYHARMALLSDVGLDVDVGEAERVLREIVGVDPRPWFRCPFGEGEDDVRVLAALDRPGYANVGWDVMAEDWDPRRTPEQVEADVTAGAAAHGDGAVVLLHAWPDRTLGAVPGIVARLRDAGANLVRIDALDRLPTTGPRWLA
jgi:peptidoglycan/xylan/chitin deacetylase (PgdA/CDA1 family)